jgi:hypothetical protein
MIPESLQGVLKQLCAGASPEVLKAVLETGSLELNDVGFTLVQGGEADAEAICIFCDFGALPSTNTVAVLKRLLEVNLFLALPGMTRLVLNSENGRVLLAHREALDTFDAERLVTVLEHMAGHAKAWCETHFLDDATPPAAAANPAVPAGRPAASRVASSHSALR